MTAPVFTSTHMAILDALLREPMAVPELARVCGMTSPGIRSALPLLQSRGLVKRLSQTVQLGMGRPCVVYRRATSWERAA